MIRIFLPISLFFLLFNVFAGDSSDIKYEIHWVSNEKPFLAVAKIHEDKFITQHDIDETNIVVSAMDNSSGKQLWTFDDGVPDCQVNHRLSFMNKYFEAVNLFDNGEPVIFFAYKIGCTGDLAPIDVKYIAFYRGGRYALHGSELLVIGGVASFNYGNLEPQPDSKLEAQPVILKYMLKKWGEVSITNMDNY
ncbi:TPA: hypothetical protein JEL63_004543 [Salmonella enterica subsp. enterica serovar Enteritidis]|uniref:M949_RS01915 family surface polysaccharide biosynthesis protein n=1 Tax=Salmonella enterica TaxID=28901 RepID=UPI0002A6DB48|nr:hypothetical protein [Salmonella enterica]EDP9826666.1 hypothetical protein [Salmonella enterica subsp. enterica]EDS4738550.1 hypothetical protein [Salmonella enterica subsp. enterica serovar Oranienburg]ELO80832.1 hypothetical protein SEEERB17_010734 [Salmonella enterica subsp. enterica serovar Enteritidis str. SARB17]EDF8720469.1 hypothetical protein [Salmonella enterica]EEH2569765.1 hypothetical protein [Salmonella enterica]